MSKHSLPILLLSLCCLPIAHARVGESAFLTGSRSGETAISVRALGEPEFAASSLELGAEGDRLNVLVAGVPKSIELARVVHVDFPAVGSAAAGFENDADVLLVDGSRFAGRLTEGAEDFLGIEVTPLGRLSIPLEQVRAIAFGNGKERSDPTTFAPPQTEDLVYRRGRGDADRVSGTCVQIGRDGVALASDVGDLNLKPNELLGIVLATADAAPLPAGRVVDVDLRPAGSLRAALHSIAGNSIMLTTHFKERIELQAAQISRLRMRGERFTYLSDLEPSQVVETPFLGNGDDFLFPFRRDTSVTGKPLLVMGELYGKGIGLHSRSRLEWKLDGKFQSFEALAGICDEVLALGIEGSVVLRIFVDGEKSFESAVIRAGKAPLVVPPIELSGKQTLAIEVDFADQGDIGDRAALLDPLLVRAD